MVLGCTGVLLFLALGRDVEWLEFGMKVEETEVAGTPGKWVEVSEPGFERVEPRGCILARQAPHAVAVHRKSKVA